MALGGGGHGTTGLCGIEHRGARAVGGDRGRPQPAAQTYRAGAHCARLGGSAFGAAGGAEHRRQPADGMAMATALCRERGRGSVARQDPQTRKAPIAAETTAQVVALTCTAPPHQATHWTGRAMAKAIGISVGSVQRIWRADRRQPALLLPLTGARNITGQERLTDWLRIPAPPCLPPRPLEAARRSRRRGPTIT